MTDEKYKCISHKIDMVYQGCMKAWIARHDRMLEFVKAISNHFNLIETEDDFMKFYVNKEYEASELLKEIGEL